MRWVCRNFFFGYVNDTTEPICLSKNIFGAPKEYYRNKGWLNIKPGDLGFLLNYDKHVIIGIFEAKSRVVINWDKELSEKGFPLQVKVERKIDIPPYGDYRDILKGVGFLFVRKRNSFLRMLYYKDCIKLQDLLYKLNVENMNDIIYIQEEEVYKEEEEKENKLIGDENPYIKKVMLKDVIGLAEVKHFVQLRFIDPLEDDNAVRDLGLSLGGGLLLYGPPGTGKTLLAEAVANETESNFVEISPTIISGYPGDAENKLRSLFNQIKYNPRTVIFLDEAEWILSERSEQGSSVMQRVIPLVLVEINQLLKRTRNPVMIIAATNKIEKIDSAFLRPGRFGHKFWVGPPDENDRIALIRYYLSNKNLADDLKDEENIKLLAKKTENYSGADIRSLIEEASFIAYERQRGRNQYFLSLDDIMKAKESILPSINKNELAGMIRLAREKGFRNV